MTLARIPGEGLWMPEAQPLIATSPGFASLLIDAAGEKIAAIGHVWWPDRAATKVCTGVEFLAGTVNGAGGTTLDISLQSISTTVGPPGQPDEVKDIADNRSLTGIPSNTWVGTSWTSGATQTLTYGELLAVVWEFGGAGPSGGALFNLRGTAILSGTYASKHAYMAQKLGGVWSQQATMLPNVVFTCADGSYGTFIGAFVCSGLAPLQSNLTSTPDERAMQFSFPGPVAIDAIALPYLLTDAVNADYSVVLYSGTTALRTVTLDYNTIQTLSARPGLFPFAEQVLAADTVYRVAFRPTTSGNLTVHAFDVATAGQLALHAGTAFHYWDRVDNGAWVNENTTRCLFAAVRVTQIDAGGAAGGGLKLVGTGGLAG